MNATNYFLQGGLQYAHLAHTHDFIYISMYNFEIISAAFLQLLLIVLTTSCWSNEANNWPNKEQIRAE